ncbi:MAG: heparan-alpha-glucosaminide N-acetyltransferase domain-containing protein [Nocardioides sp.]
MVGIDLARCLALLGMMATHVLSESDADGSISFAQELAGGRASALFAVLAGMSLALMTGGTRPVMGRERVAASAGLAVRALLVALLGLLLGDLESGLAVILTYYGVLFLCGLPFLGLGPRALLALAAGWLVTAPLLSQLLRPELPPRGTESPTFGQLADPGQLLSELLLTGYYPVVPWLAYLLAGMALGRLDLRRRRVQAWTAGSGAALALAATLVSAAFTRQSAVVAALRADPAIEESGPELLARIGYGMFGTTPTGGAWEWLLVVAPHSATPFDLAQTIGSAFLVIGLCLVVVGALSSTGERFVAVFFGAGAMTLSLYSLHVVMKTPEVWPSERPDTYVWHVLVVLGIGSAYAAWRRPGPLERIVSAAARRTRLVSGHPSAK